MSEEIVKKRRGRPPGAAKKISVEDSIGAADTVTLDPEEFPPVPQSSEVGPAVDYGFHFLDTPNDYGDSWKVALEGVSSARKNQPISFKRMADVREGFAFPFKHFLMQYAVGQFGVPSRKIIDIIGAEGIGKTTLTMQMLGWAMDVGCPAMYVECESKLIAPARAMRALHPNIVRSFKMLERLRIEPVNSLDHMWQSIKDFVFVARGSRGVKDTPRIPMHVPIVIAIDPWSKLLNPDEAAGFYNYGDNMGAEKKKKFKEINEGSNLGHAKWAHKWCRLLPTFLAQYNVVLIIVHHQNDKIDMSGGGQASYMSAEQSALYNKTRIGGKALHQNTALTLVLSRKGLAKNSAGDVTGNNILCRVAKNSLGHDNIKFMYELKTGHFDDTATSIEPAINFDPGFALLCAENKWLSTTVKGSKYSSPVLNVHDLSATEFYAAFESQPEHKFALGRQLNINGYVDVVDKIKELLSANYMSDNQYSIESNTPLVLPTGDELDTLRKTMSADGATDIDSESGNEEEAELVDAPDAEDLAAEQYIKLTSVIADIDARQLVE